MKAPFGRGRGGFETGEERGEAWEGIFVGVEDDGGVDIVADGGWEVLGVVCRCVWWVREGRE